MANVQRFVRQHKVGTGNGTKGKRAVTLLGIEPTVSIRDTETMYDRQKLVGFIHDIK